MTKPVELTDRALFIISQLSNTQDSVSSRHVKALLSYITMLKAELANRTPVP